MAKWIWYPGSFELYHGMLLHNRRTSASTYEVDGVKIRKPVYYYPMWRVDAPNHNAKLFKRATTVREETVYFHANTDDACIVVDGRSYPPNHKITIAPGEHTVYIQGFKKDGFPAFFCEGETFASDRTWLVAENDEKALRHAGESDYYTDPCDNPEIFKFLYKSLSYASYEKTDGGILYDFGKEVFGKVVIASDSDGEIFLALGESREEAIDFEYGILALNANVVNGKYCSEAVALRYIFIPNTNRVLDIHLELEYLPLENRGSFKCDNELVNSIWQASAYTMLLNSREGFFDGIKRDRWVWSGDAYQSYLVNYYLFADRDIVRRTVRMLRGADPIKKHINTICDYTFYWICSVWDYYFHTKDSNFVTDIYPEMLDVWSFIEGRLDDDGMYKRYSDDWVFIDWSTFDSNGPMCAEQMLLCRAYECLASCALLVGDDSTAQRCKKQSAYIMEQINLRYWDEERGAFIDDYKSGKRNVTRHANIFALLFDYTTEERKAKIIENVIYNKKITPITTPYFEFFELDAMCKIGDFKYMTDMLDSYWGGMLRLGATTIWEEFDPKKTGIEHYEMYGGKYEKSLCHAWGASPIYLLGKYALGVYPTSAGYESFEVKPNLMCFKHFEGCVPVGDSKIFVSADENEVSVLSEIDGGTLILGDRKYKIERNIPLKVKIS